MQLLKFICSKTAKFRLVLSKTKARPKKVIYHGKFFPPIFEKMLFDCKNIFHFTSRNATLEKRFFQMSPYAHGHGHVHIIYEKRKENSNENITWSEMEKQNVAANRVHCLQ